MGTHQFQTHPSIAFRILANLLPPSCTVAISMSARENVGPHGRTGGKLINERKNTTALLFSEEFKLLELVR